MLHKGLFASILDVVVDQTRSVAAVSPHRLFYLERLLFIVAVLHVLILSTLAQKGLRGGVQKSLIM